jgi:class 3 adenylate cyclase
MAGSHTFLFTDLVGFTALTAAEGDERAADVAIEFGERVKPLLERHRSEQIKAIGDALMLRADDPADGIRLGLDIVEELDRVTGFPPVRVGVHSGPAVERGGDWYGATVNVAARLCSAAAGGQVLASEEAVRAAADTLGDVELGESRLHWLKNVTEPVAARSVAARERIGRFRHRIGELASMIGPAAGGSPA